MILYKTFHKKEPDIKLFHKIFFMKSFLDKFIEKNPECDYRQFEFSMTNEEINKLKRIIKYGKNRILH